MYGIGPMVSLSILASDPQRMIRRLFHRDVASLSPEEALQSIDDPFRSALLSLYRNESVFQKMGNDSRRWDHFQRFGVTGG
jgi:hypothetical protein